MVFLPEWPPHLCVKKMRNPLIWQGDERHVKQMARIDFYRGEQEDDLQNVEWEAWLQNMPCVMIGPLRLNRMEAGARAQWMESLVGVSYVACTDGWYLPKGSTLDIFPSHK